MTSDRPIPVPEGREPSRDRSAIVCICGSTRFPAEILEAARAETMQGRIVLAPGVFSQADGEQLGPEVIRRLNDLHAEKIRMADEVLVVDVGGRVGETTAQEAAYAVSLGKPVRYWSKTTGR
jgi:hypothetical protein